MPSRKKAADGAPVAPTRSSARTKAAAEAKAAAEVSDAAAATAVAAAQVAAPPPAANTNVAPKSRSKRSRSRANSVSEDEAQKLPRKVPKAAAKPKSKRSRSRANSDAEDKASKPASKKAKTAKGKAKQQDEDDEADDQDPQDDAADDDIPEEPKKMVTVIKKGAAPVDPQSGKVDTHMVYSDSTVWDAMLNQTDVSGNENKNKFYVLQLLHPNNIKGQCFLYTRWGRVGENGQNQFKGPWSPQVAISEFKKQFKAKAAVNWEDRIGMVARKGKYTWIERDYSDEDDIKDDEKAGGKKEPAVVPDSKLETEIQDLCKLIFSTTLIDAHLSSMNYDAKKLPLGKLANSTIKSGFAALKTLADVIANPNGATAQQYGGVRDACEHLSGAYYSIIPHDFGRLRPTVISTLAELQRELNLVDALEDMEIATKLISSNIHDDADGNPINPIDANFRSLGLTSMEPVKRDSQEFKTLAAYARDTHGATHRNIQVTVTNAYRVERASETRAWNKKKFDKLQGGERLLLWHGSRTTNFASILKNGLRIAPPEAPVNGYMFGKGVYFADMMSKSANYCYSYLSNNTGLLLLCEVAAKPFHELTSASYNADQECLSNKKLATKGVGRTQPVEWKDAGEALENEELMGCQMPAGPGKDVSPPNAHLQYNEYIVYDPSQIRLKYLLMVKM